MIPLLIFVFVLSALTVVFKTENKKINQLLVFILTLVLVFVAAFREPDTDRDYQVYRIYWFDDNFIDVEFSFLFIKNVLKNFFLLPLSSLFFVYAVIGVLVKLKAIRILSGTFYASVLIYLSNYYLVHELTQIRAGVAAGLFLIAIKYTYEKKLKSFLFFMALAGTFHYSALMALPIWFLGTDNKKIKGYLYIIPLGFVLYFLGANLIAKIPIPYVQNRIEVYEIMRDMGIGGKEVFNIFSIAYLGKVGIFLLLYLNKEKLGKHNNYFFIMLRIYSISLFIFPLLSEIPAFSFRVQSLLGVVDIVLIPLLLHLFREKFFGYFSVIIIAIVFFFYNLFISELIV